MALIPLRSRSNVKTSMMLLRADHLFLQNYIRSLLNIILIYTYSNGPDGTYTRKLIRVYLIKL